MSHCPGVWAAPLSIDVDVAVHIIQQAVPMRLFGQYDPSTTAIADPFCIL